MTLGIHLLYPLLLLHILLFSTPTSVHSQPSYVPVTTWGSASVYIDGKAFYIQSGRLTAPQGYSRQVFSIDLTTAWSVGSPAYTQMPDGLDSHVFPNALMQDGKTWFALRNNSLFTYDLTTGVLKQGPLIPTYTGTHALAASRDPVTGEMVIPGGYYSSQQLNTTLRLSPERLTVSSVPAFTELDNRRYYAMAASESARAVFSFGGLIGLNVMASFVRLDSGATSWRSAATASDPSPRALACLASAYGGNKLVLFGGETQLDELLGDIYIFDVASSTWARGAEGGLSRARAGHVCAVSGDMFLTWGGFRNVSSRAPVQETMSVYNMKTNSWVDRYTPSVVGPAPGSGSDAGNDNSTGSPGVGSGTGDSPPPPPDSNTKSGSGQGSNVAAIAGGAGVAVAVLLGALILIFRRRSAAHRDMRSATSEGTEDRERASYPPSRTLERNSIANVPLAHPPYTNSGHYPPPPIPRHSKHDAQLCGPQNQAFGIEAPEHQHKIEYAPRVQSVHQEDQGYALDLQIERQQAELQMLKEQRLALRAGSPPVPEYHSYGRPGIMDPRGPQGYRYQVDSQYPDSPGNNRAGDIRASLQVSRDWYSTFEPQLWHHDRQNGYTSPCAYLKSLRIKDKNIDEHPRHEYHTILGRPLEGLYISGSNILTGSVEALNLG
ncbi:hypothetical protein BGZ82_002349 [Podila clonocystis]|nr:hypothetical protein BGZ82_002349 [Podila clonocystis]